MACRVIHKDKSYSKDEIISALAPIFISNAKKSKTQNAQTAPAEGQAAPTQSAQSQAPQITDEQRTEATRFANELKTEGIIPDTYSEMITDQDATPFWQFVAQQAQNVDENWMPLEGEENVSEQAAIDAFGETIVDYAKELFPISQQKIETDENEISQETSTQEGGEEINAEETGSNEEADVLAEQGAQPTAEAPLTEQETVAQKGKVLADRIRSLKLKNDVARSDIFGIGTSVYNGAIESVAIAIEQGARLINAINKGIKYIREKGGENLDEKAFREFLKDVVIKEEDKVIYEVGDNVEVEEETMKYSKAHQIIIRVNGVGEIVLGKEKNDKNYGVDYVEVDKSLRGKGKAKKLYYEAIKLLNERGLFLEPGGYSAPKAVSVWKRLEKEGLATIESIVEGGEEPGHFIIKGKTTGKSPVDKSLSEKGKDLADKIRSLKTKKRDSNFDAFDRQTGAEVPKGTYNLSEFLTKYEVTGNETAKELLNKLSKHPYFNSVKLYVTDRMDEGIKGEAIVTAGIMKVSPNVDAETIAHEMMHFLTSKIFTNPYETLSPSEKQLRNGVNKIIKEVDPNLEYLDRTLGRLGYKRSEYAQEIIAEAFTGSWFAKELEGKQVKVIRTKRIDKNLIQKVIDKIVSFLGGQISDTVKAEEKANVVEALKLVFANHGSISAQRLKELNKPTGKYESLKSRTNIFGVSPEIYDDALETIAAVVEQGAALIDAINQGIQYIRDNGGNNLDEAGFRKHIEDQVAGDKPRIRARLNPEGPPTLMSSITHGRTEETRKEFALGDSYEKFRKADEDLEKQADAEIKKGYDIENLISKIERGTIPTDVENTILKKYKATLEAQIAKNPSDENLNQLKRLVQATDKIGSETGRALRSRQGMEFRDDSLAGFFVQDINANLQAPLTEEQKKTVISEHEKISFAQAAYDKKIEALEAENAKLRAESSLKKEKKAAPSKEKKTHADFVKERKDAIEAAREKLKKLRGSGQVTIVPYANELFAIAPEVGKVVKSLVEEGVTNLAEITKNVYDTFKEIVPELTVADVNNIIAGEYVQKRTRNELSEILRDLRDEATLINKYEALLNGEQPKSERAKKQRNQQIEELRKKIQDLTKKPPEDSKLAATKSRLKTEIKKLEEQLKSGDFATASKKEPLALDKEANELKDKLIKLRQERQLRLLKLEYEQRSKARKIFDAAANVLNVPRSLMASLDFSAPLRQAAIVTVSNPKTAALAGLEMFRQAWSQKRFDRWFFDLQESPRYELMQQAGLYVADPHDPRLTVREEQFMSNLAQKIPLIGRLVSGSERAYVAYLNKMRVDLFNRYADALENDGFTWSNHPEMYEGLAKFLNNSTGRGDLGGLEAAAPFLNTAFFSPRLMASRLNILGLNPTYYKSLPPKIRNEAFKSLGLFIGVGAATLFLLSTAFGCEDGEGKDCLDVELDPRSSDFGKIRSGKTRWDLWAGFQQYIRLIAQLISGQTKTVTTGEIKELDGEGINRSRADQLFSFFRGKLAPVPSFVIDRMSGGRNVIGEKQSVLEAAGTRLFPLVAADLAKSIQDNGVRAIFTQGVPALFGVGVQNYLPRGYEDKNMKDPVYNFLYEKNININPPGKKKEMTDEQYDQFVKERDPIIKTEWEQAIRYGIMINEKGNATIDENAAVKIVPADKATYEQLTQLMKSISNKATRDAQKEDNE